MIARYRDYTINVQREEGWLCVAVLRDFDEYICVENYYPDCSDTVREMVKYMKERVDAELSEDDPWGHAEECGCGGDRE